MEARGSGSSSFAPLGPTLEDEVQNENNDNGQDDDGSGAEAQNVFHLKDVKIDTNALCSRNFQNVKLRLDFVEI